MRARSESRMTFRPRNSKMRDSTSGGVFSIAVVFTVRNSFNGDGLNQFVKIALDIKHTAEFGEGPAAKFAEVVDSRNPTSADGVSLFFSVFAAETFDLDDQVEGVFVAASIVHLDDEVGKVFARGGPHQVRDLEVEALVFRVGADAGMRFSDTAEFRLPIAIAHDPVDMTLARVCLPDGAFGGGEIDVPRRALRVVSVEDRFDLVLAFEGFGDGGFDPFAGHVGNFSIEDLSRISGTAATKVPAIHPLPDDAFKLAKKVELRLLARVGGLGIKEMPGEAEKDRGWADVLQVFQIERDALTDNPLVSDDRWADQPGREGQNRVLVKSRREPIRWQFDTIALDAGETDFQRIALRADGKDMRRRSRRLGWRDHRFRGEVERDAENVSVFDGE